MYVQGKIDQCLEEDIVIIKVEENLCILFGKQFLLQIRGYFEASLLWGFLYSIANIQSGNLAQIPVTMMALLPLQLVSIYFNYYENKLSQMAGAIMGYIAGYFIFNETVHDLLKFEEVPFLDFCKTYVLAYILLYLGFSLIYKMEKKIQICRQKRTSEDRRNEN